jgi:hypothetical protein
MLSASATYSQPLVSILAYVIVAAAAAAAAAGAQGRVPH